MAAWLFASWLSGMAFAAPPDRSIPPALAGDWEMTSGYVVVRSTAPPSPAPSAPVYGSDAPVFRMRTTRSDYGDVRVDVDVLNHGISAAGDAWDGIHVWLRYQDPTHLYAVSFNRRDGRVIIKKKVTGGSSYGGTYYNLTETAPYSVPYGLWQHVTASALDRPDGGVALQLRVDGRVLLEAVDDGSIGGPPIAGPGRVGLRADNADFDFTAPVVTPVSSAK